HQIMEADLPVLITMTMSVDYAPKYPSFMAAHKAQDKQISTWTAADIGADLHKLGLEGSPTRVSRIFPPATRAKGEMISGSAEEMAAKFIEILKKESFVK
ncbi:MAG: electron transfer flavoprotein subunit beta, partial [Elusimicrobiaceae bacterium]|nr:electron transfer flavoprotein subunit beta [Elusimicrobiaceae bacterium]